MDFVDIGAPIDQQSKYGITNNYRFYRKVFLLGFPRMDFNHSTPEKAWEQRNEKENGGPLSGNSNIPGHGLRDYSENE